MFSGNQDARRAEALEDCDVLGIPPETLPPAQDQDGIWEQNVPALEAFLDVATQFNRFGLADGRTRTTGLNYASARVAWDLAGVDMTPGLFGQIQMIEHAAVAEWNRK